MNIPTSFQSIGDLFTGSGTGAIDIGIILKGGNIDLTKIDWGVVDWTSFKDMADYSNLDWGELDLSGLQTLKDIPWAQIDSNLLDLSSTDWATFDSAKYDNVDWKVVDFSKFDANDFFNIDWSDVDLAALNPFTDYQNIDWKDIDWSKLGRESFDALDVAAVDWAEVDNADWHSIDASGINATDVAWGQMKFEDNSGTDFIKALAANFKGNDTLTGDADGDYGNDRLDGGEGNDKIFGGFGMDSLLGGMGDDKMDGGQGADILDGGEGNDKEAGGIGNDELTGGAGKDILTGGAGDDTNIIADADIMGKAYDIITEKPGEGIDTVISKISSYMLGHGMENLRLTGSGDGFGNKLGNYITGAEGANILNGKGGNDILTGGAGADKFIFDTKLGAGNIDHITDFELGIDEINLSKKIFAAYNKRTLTEDEFVSGVGVIAKEEGDHFIYDTSTGNLYYDADGSGNKEEILIGILDNNVKLTVSDLNIF